MTGDLEADVRWTAKGRALLALFVPAGAWLAVTSFTSETQPSPAIGALAIGGALGALVLQVHLAVYRVRAGAGGITERSLRGTRHVPWKDVQKVELVAQARDGNKIQRWASSPEEAFHVIVHTRAGRVSVHRWMRGVDDFIAALERPRAATYREAAGPVAGRDDPSVTSVLAPSPLGTAVNRANEGLEIFQAAVVAVMLSVFVGLLVVMEAPSSFLGSPWIGGVMAVIALWALAFAGYVWIAHVRRARFGPCAMARQPASAVQTADPS